MAANDNVESNEQINMFSKEEQKRLQEFFADVEIKVDTDLEEALQKNSSSTSKAETDQTNSSSSSNSNSSNKRKRPASTQKGNQASASAKDSKSTSLAATTTAVKVEATRAGRARKAPHELLSEDQKKANHIASEQKRRANIRIGFDQLVETVPTLDSCHRSESAILQKSVDYIKELLEDKNKLKERLRELQLSLGEVPDEDSSEGELEDRFIYKKEKV